MTCKQCVNRFNCKDEAEQHNPNLANKMYTIDFWKNAEESCSNFKEDETCQQEKKS